MVIRSRPSANWTRMGIRCCLPADLAMSEATNAPKGPKFLERLTAIVDDIAERFHLEITEHQSPFQRSECLSALALLPFIRQGEPVREKWDVVVDLAHPALSKEVAPELQRELLSALPPPRREARLLDLLAHDAAVGHAETGLETLARHADLVATPRLAEEALRLCSLLDAKERTTTHALLIKAFAPFPWFAELARPKKPRAKAANASKPRASRGRGAKSDHPAPNAAAVVEPTGAKAGGQGMREWTVLEDLVRFRSASREQRLAVRTALLQKLGTEWSAGKLSMKVDALFVVYKPMKLDFALVPGGRFEMGFRESDLEDASEWVDPSEILRDAIADMQSHARPVHEVRVRPFLCTCNPVDGAHLRAQGVSPSDRAALRAMAAEHGFRLASEAELEWMLRGGDRHALGLDAGRELEGGDYDACFGVDKLALPVWADDDWHPSYEGAPADSSPWLQGDPAGVHRGNFVTIRGADELAVAFAAKRCRGATDDGDMYVHWARPLDLAVLG